MAITLPPIDYTARDFTAIKDSLVAHVKTYFPNDWQDFTESNLGMCLLELAAYVGDQLHFYLDSQANETYIVTVRQRQNAINLAALVGYVPRTVAAASAPIRAIIDTPQSNETVIEPFFIFNDVRGNVWEFLETIVIPINRTDTNNIDVTNEVLGQGDGVSYVFAFNLDNKNVDTTQDVVISVTIGAVTYNSTAREDGTIALPFGGNGLLDAENGTLQLFFNSDDPPDNATNLLITYEYDQAITAYQGQTKLGQFTSDGAPNQAYTLSQTPVLFDPIVDPAPPTVNPNRFEVWIGDPAAPFGNATGTQWTRVDTLVTAGSADTVYQLKMNDQDQVVVLFGDDSNGAAPPPGAIINIIYRTGGGLKGNIAIGDIKSTVTAQSGLLQISVNITNTDRGSGGAERESLDEIRINAPAFARTNDTATTESDFDDLSSSFSRAGFGAIVRAKSRLEPPITVETNVIHTSALLAVVPNSPPTIFDALMPGTPAILSTIIVSYQVAGLPVSVTASDLGSGLATLTGHPTIDSANTRLRYDQQDFTSQGVTGFVGDGIITAFGPANITGIPIFPSSLIMHYSIGGDEFVGYDDGVGNITGPHISSGTINYATGSVSITFDTPVDDGTSILFDFQSCIHLVFNTAPDAGSNITISMQSGPNIETFPTNNIQVYTWSYDSLGNLVPPGVTLMDQLKAYLDLRRVLCTSVEILPGNNVKTNLYLTVVYDPAVSQSDTNDRIVTAIDDYFKSVVDVRPGEDVALAAVYDAMFPLYGVATLVVQQVGITVPVGYGNGVNTIFKTNILSPGHFVADGKLPAKSGDGQIIVYKNSTVIGTSGAGSPSAPLSGSGVSSGSFFNITTGDFLLKLSSAPLATDLISIRYFLDELGSEGMSLWNISIESWEIAVVGDIFVNDVKVN